MNKQLKPFLAGVDLAGRRLPNGKLESYGLSKELLDDWPQELKLFGHCYELEKVIKGIDCYEHAVYV